MTITIGQRLKKAREEQRLTLEKVFETTRIRVQYLQALEDDDLSVMPSPVQARGYLRNYAEFLGFDVGRLLEELREANAARPPDEVAGPADLPAPPAPQPHEPSLPPKEAPGEKASPLVKPKAPRRRKADPAPMGDPDSPPRRRSRKQTGLGPELMAQLATQKEPFDVDAEGDGTPAAEEARPPSKAQAGGAGPGPETGTRPAEVPQPLVEAQSAPDTGDVLWQTWLSRLGSTLAARQKRRTLKRKEPVGSGPDVSIVPPAEERPAPPSAESHPAPENSTQIFQEIGKELRERRELLSLHLEEVERNTHVKAHYLDALERGAMDDLPSTVQTRGMLSNYATFLDLDVDTLLLRFADALQARYRERNPQKPSRKPGQPILANLPPVRSFIAGDLIFGIGIVVLLVGFAIWGVSRVLTLQSQQEVNPTAPSISDILLASPDPSSYTATPTTDVIEAFPGQPTVTVVIPTLSANVNVQVNLIAVERTYMRVIVDGEVVFEGRVVPGTAYPFEAVDQVEVLVGSGAAIRILYNGRDMGLLGSFGQIISNIYRSSEIVTPTGLPTATASITPTPTSTVPPTATPRFTATADTPIPSNTAPP